MGSLLAAAALGGVLHGELTLPRTTAIRGGSRLEESWRCRQGLEVSTTVVDQYS